MTRYGRLVVAPLVVAVSLVCSAGAQAAGWVPGPTVGAGAIVGAGGVASDRSGVTTVAWIELAPGLEEVGALWVQRIAPDGTPGPARLLGQAPFEEQAAVAVTPAGTAVVAWPDTAITDTTVVKLATIRPDGSLGSVRDVATVESIDFVETSVRVGVDDAGNATVIWVTDSQLDGSQLRIRRMPAAGAAATELELAARLGARVGARVAVAPDGNVRVGWIGRDAAANNVYRAWIARIDPTGTVSGVRAVSSAFRDAAGLSVAASASGAVVTWAEFEPGETALHDVRGVRLSAAGEVSGDLFVADGIPQFLDPGSSAIAPDGAVTVVWNDIRSFQEATVRFRRFAPNGSPSPSQDLGGPKPVGVVDAYPTMAVASDGAVFTSWMQGGTGDGSPTVRLFARRIDPAGVPEATEFLGLVALSEVGAPRPTSIAPDGLGGATIGWYAPSRTPLAGYAMAAYDGTPPTVDAAVPASIGIGEPAQFDATARDRFGIRSYHWDFGDGSSTQQASTQHIYGRAGAYSVVFTVVDRAGNETIVRRTLTVTPPQTGKGDEPRPDPEERPAAKRSRAALKLGKVTRKASMLTVAGTISRRASGKVTVSYAQRIGRKTMTATRAAKIAKGRFRVTLRLTGKLARAKKGKAKLQVRYAGDADTMAARAQRIVTVRVRH